MELMEWIFVISAVAVLYSYVGYPCVLYLLSVVRNHVVMRSDVEPHVSFIITAHNEEARIADKIDNTLLLSYPREKFEIIVASDCSTDLTDDIVRRYFPRITLVRSPSRAGKEAAQKLAIEASTGEVLVFSDVATIVPENGVRNMTRNFADPSVGCVSSVDRFIEADGEVSGEGLYVKYEMFLRDLEGRVNSLVGLSGSFFAARRSLCRTWAPDLQSDFNTVLNAVRAGLRGVADPHSIGYYQNLADESKEFDRKVRTVTRGISVLMRNRQLLNPLTYGLFAWQLASHKLLRWSVPFFLIVMLLSSGMLGIDSAVYLGFFWLQVAFYLAGIIGYVGRDRWQNTIIKVPYFFMLVNLSILKAWIRYVVGDRAVAWQPSVR